MLQVEGVILVRLKKPLANLRKIDGILNYNRKNVCLCWIFLT